VVRLAGIGKDVMGPVSEAYYNDYVIDNLIGRRAAKKKKDVAVG
jgi:hypothetical protein